MCSFHQAVEFMMVHTWCHAGRLSAKIRSLEQNSNIQTEFRVFIGSDLTPADSASLYLLVIQSQWQGSVKVRDSNPSLRIRARTLELRRDNANHSKVMKQSTITHSAWNEPWWGMPLQETNQYLGGVMEQSYCSYPEVDYFSVTVHSQCFIPLIPQQVSNN